MPRIESPSGRRSTRERIQKSFIKLYSALFIVGGVASIFNYFQCIIPPNTPLIPAIIFRFQYYFHILTLELVQLGSYSSHQRSSAMRYFIEDASRGDLQAYNYCSKLELVNVLSFAIATFLWTAIFILIYMYLGGLDRKESGQVDFRYGSREEAMEKEMRRIESLTEEERNAEIESLKKEEREAEEAEIELLKKTLTFSNGDQYVGEFKDGKRHGQGTYTYVSGATYVGEFKNGRKHGKGTMTYAYGDQYVGEWKDDKFHGQGTYTKPNGARYVGKWERGAKTKGSATLSNGYRYVGKFKNGKPKGKFKKPLSWRVLGLLWRILTFPFRL